MRAASWVVNLRFTKLLGRSCVPYRKNVVLIRHLGRDLVASLERPFQLRGLVYMQPDFMASRIVHRIKFPLDLQHISFDRMGATTTSHVDVSHRKSMALIGGLGFDLVASLEGPFQLRGLVYMQPDFMASRIVHGIKFPLNLQHIPIHSLGRRCHLASWV